MSTGTDRKSTPTLLAEIQDALGDNAARFTCDEADAIVAIYTRIGHSGWAEEFLALHIEEDEPDDKHRRT